MRSVGFLALDREKIGTKLYGYVLAKRYTSVFAKSVLSQTRSGFWELVCQSGYCSRTWDSRWTAYVLPQCNAVPTSEWSCEPCRYHDFLVEVPTFESFLDWYKSRHLSIIPELLVRLRQSRILHRVN